MLFSCRRRATQLGAVLCSTVMLAACAAWRPPAADASPPLSAQSSELAAPWREAAGLSVGDASQRLRWWSRFGDARLDGLIDDALRTNPALDRARASWMQARALREVAAAGLLPSLSGGASVQRGRSPIQSTATTYGLSLDAAWELDLFGGTRAGVRAAQADADAAADALADAQVSLVAEVALEYLSLRGAEWRRTIAQDNLASQQSTLQLTEWRRQAGLASSLDVEQARSAVEQTRATVPAFEQAIAQSLHALAVLTGRAPAQLATDVASPAGMAIVLPEPGAELALSLPAETLRQRPDLRQAERGVTAAAARVDQAEAARYPSFTLSGSLGLSALTLGGLTQGSAVSSALLGSLAAPLFDGGATRAQAASQRAALDQARAAYRSTVLAALQEVEDALVALQRTRERLAALEAAVTSAGNAALLAEQRYGSGLIDFQVVLTTQRTLLTAQDAVASARTDLLGAHVALYKALGGGWQPDAPDGAVLGQAAPPPATVSAPTPSRRPLPLPTSIPARS